MALTEGEQLVERQHTHEDTHEEVDVVMVTSVVYLMINRQNIRRRIEIQFRVFFLGILRVPRAHKQHYLAEGNP
jgi:hypothetical protein